MPPRILYRHCAYARVVPAETKVAVLRDLTAREVAFDAVPDLCEMAARRDPRLGELATGDDPLRIAACYPRAVRWLFASAGVNIDRPNISVLNMRTDPADQVVAGALAVDVPAAAAVPEAKEA